MQHLLRSGCPKGKLVLGIPAFGRSYTLFSSYSTGLNALVKGLGKRGNITLTDGFLGYNEVRLTANVFLIFWIFCKTNLQFRFVKKYERTMDGKLLIFEIVQPSMRQRVINGSVMMTPKLFNKR